MHSLDEAFGICSKDISLVFWMYVFFYICSFSCMSCSLFAMGREISSGGYENNINMPPEVSLHILISLHCTCWFLAVYAKKMMKLYTGLIRKLPIAICQCAKGWSSLLIVVAQWWLDVSVHSIATSYLLGRLSTDVFSYHDE